ncbi:hypothetical protein HF086_006909 [Spodoptera exigua]|uniref:Multidrug resistance protein homolog 49-like n=1 Tax=Spodoptera exigua TaxID=7107 RepID=A0A922SGX7_SPOEX|nr:hypothetical protein HF086_006909 [Spodoptera exigua]
MGFRKKKSDATPENELDISFLGIFRYGTFLEITATFIGIFISMISGGGIAYNLIQVGELSTAFVERTSFQDQPSSNMPLLSVFGGGKRLNNASHEENMEALLQDATAMLIGAFVSVGISMLCCAVSVAFISWSALRQITTIRMRFLEAVLRQDMAWFDTDNEFNLASKMSENLMKLKEGMSEKLAVVGNLLGTSVISIAVAIPLGWELALACITVMPFSVAASVYLTNYQTKSSARELESYSQAGKHAEEILKSIKTVVAFGGEEKEVRKYRTLLEPAEKYGRKRGIYTGVGNGFNWVLTYCLNAIGLVYGIRLVLEDRDKSEEERRYVVGVVFSVLFNVYMATQSITLCVPHFEVFAAARGAAASIYYLLEREPAIDSLSTQGVSPRRVVGNISFEDIHFNYPSRPDVKVLKGFSLHIKAGECVALVGSSGCGKSTILQLLQRLYDPQSGSVKLDGKELRNLNLGWLRSSLGVVGQEPVLFHGTIFENIAIACPEATLPEVQRVAAMAYAHDFITNLPKGYDTVIGERGASLSGGQKQRIAIARSLLREPAVLLLDEATSALDPHSERKVQAALDRASAGRTTIMVSHRLSTILNANRIICMDQGVIVEQGTHEELMKNKGFYYKLVTTNKQKGEPEEGTEPLPELLEEDNEAAVNNHVRSETKKNRPRMSKQNSVIESFEWMQTPRGSVTSAVSLGYQSFLHNQDIDKNDNNDEEIVPLSGWEILKLNSPEWVYITIGSVAAFLQGACFPAFALLFGFTSGEIGYYDRESNTVGALCARLSGDAAEVQGATGMRVGLILQGVSSVVLGVLMGLSFDWKLTLVATAFLPIVSIFLVIYYDVIVHYQKGPYTKSSMESDLLDVVVKSTFTHYIPGRGGIDTGVSILLLRHQARYCNYPGDIIGTDYYKQYSVLQMIGSIWLEGMMSRKSQEDERDAMESATGVATEAIVSIKTVQSLGIEPVFLDKFQESLTVACKAVAQKSRWRGVVLGIGIYAPLIAFCCAIMYGASLVSKGELEYKIVLLVTESVMFGAYMLGQTLVYAPSFHAAKVSAARIIGLIQRQPLVRTEDGVTDKKDWSATGNFSIKEVEFSYPTRKHHKVLKGIDLHVDAGKTVALVGPSGCGKSTVLQLLQRFYDPDSGRIELDGLDNRSSLTLPRLRRQLGVVQQEPVLFDRTLAENIAYGDNTRKVTMHEIIEAAKAANIHTFITSLPKVVSEALEKAAEGRTCVTIAHRLTTIKDADLICVLDKGKIVERGNHADLLKLKGHYWRMCRGQEAP